MRTAMICAIALLGNTAAAGARPTTRGSGGAAGMNKVVGMWKPRSIQANHNGQTSTPFGPRPDGLLVFAENLHFVEVINNPEVPKFAAGGRQDGTAEENKAAVAGSLGLYGTYTVDADGNFTGNHVDGATFPNWIGNNRSRDQLVEVVDGDTMTETFHDTAGGVVVSIVWQRVK